MSSSLCTAQSVTITGHVKAPHGSVPPQFQVVLIDKDNVGIVRQPDLIDAATGAFKIENVQEGSYIVVACAGTTYAPSKLEIQVKEGKARRADLTLTVPSQRWPLNGRFKKIANVNVSILFYDCELASVRTDDQGEFKFEKIPVPPQTYALGARGADGRLLKSKPITMKPGAETRVNLSLATQGSETSLSAELVLVPKDLRSAIAALNVQVKRSSSFFAAPSIRLQAELLNNDQAKEAAKQIIQTLYEHKQDLTKASLERAALLAFALEDYQRAAAFVDTGLNRSPGNKQLLAARGLIQYGQSLYPQALASLQEATPSAPVGNSDFRAALMGNEGLVHWELGQTKIAETSLSNSIALFRGDEATQQQAYLLLTLADLYADYGQPAKALEMSREALKLTPAPHSDKDAHVVEGQIHRLMAKVALFRGIINQAKQEIEQAIKIHAKESSFLELAQDKDVQADIEELTGRHREALETLQEAAALYKDTNYIKGQSENRWKRANVLLALNEFDEAERLIDNASTGFTRLNYRRGLGECEELRGVLILRQANHKYLMRPNMTLQEKQAADREFLSQIRPGVERFEKAIRIFQEIGYKRGVAFAQDKLAINLVQLKNQDEPPSEEEYRRTVDNGENAAQIYEEIGDRRGQAVTHGNLGIIFRKYRQYKLALTHLERALQICKEIDFKLGIGRQLFNLGRVHYEKSEPDLLKAKDYFLEAQRVFKETQAGEDELKLIDNYLKTLP